MSVKHYKFIVDKTSFDDMVQCFSVLKKLVKKPGLSRPR